MRKMNRSIEIRLPVGAGRNQPVSTTIVDAIESAAVANPRREAVRHDGVGIVYENLMRHVDCLAERISESTDDKTGVVAVYGDRSLEMIVALLAALKSGCGYIPLDRQYPRDRLEFVLRETGAKLVLTTSTARDELSGLAAQVLEIDLSRDVARTRNDTAFPDITSDDLAYVMYTSGSNGLPKGVMISHGNLLYSNNSRYHVYSEHPGQFLLLSSHAFDSSVVGIFWTLTSGGRLVLPGEGEESDPSKIIETISRESITHTLCLPSLYARILERSGEGELDSLNTVIVAGEACPVKVAKMHYARLGNASLYNEYGPTEATVWSTVYRSSGAESEPSLPIGEPLPGMGTKVLDDLGCPVDHGATGELYIHGPGVAMGYLNSPELTKRLFVENPESPGEKMYRTGDLGYYDERDELVFVGRVDDQVKVRGYRIEPTEIEMHLSALDEISDAAVTADGDTLVAYLVPSGSSDIQLDQLHRCLRTRLPAYMLPSSISIVEDFPRLPNGKVDRSSLKSKCIDGVNGQYCAPRDQVEFNLRGLFENALNLRPVGIFDNFFDLGGHSLMAVDLINQIESVFTVFVPLPVLFEAPTVAGIADYMRSMGAERTSHPVVKVKRTGSRSPLFCVPGVGGHTLRHLILPRYLTDEQPYYVFQASGLDGGACLTSIESLASYYIDAMRTIQPVGPYFLAGECFGGIVAFEMAQQLKLQGEEIELLALIECFFPINAAGRFQKMCDELKTKYPWLLKRLVQNTGAESSPEKPAAKQRSKQADTRKLVIRGREDVLGQGVEGERALANAAPHLKVRYANRSAGNTYRPKAYAGELTLFLTPPGTPKFMDRRLIWQRYTSKGVEKYTIAGNANTMLREPDVCVLADKLNQCLERIHLQPSRKNESE